MPSITSPGSPASHATLETLLLCAEVVQNGETAQSFNLISTSLKDNPLLNSSPTFDPGRLSGDTLRERWRDLLKDEGLVTGTATTTRASGRNGSAGSSGSSGGGGTVAGTSSVGEKAVRDLTRRYWETYQNMMRDQIRTDEAEIAHLLDEIGNLENEQARELEAAAEREVAATASKPVSEPTSADSPAAVVAKAQQTEIKKADEVPLETSTSQQQQTTQLRIEPPSPSKASLKNILSDEPTPTERPVPLERQTSSDSASRVGYDPIRDGGRARENPPPISETPQPRYPPIQPTETLQGGYQIYEKPPPSIRRASGSGPRPHPPPEFLPSTSPSRPPVTPNAPRIGTFPQRGSEVGSSPVYTRHDHDQGFQNGQQSPLNALAHAASRQPDESRTPRQIPIPPSYSPTTSSYPIQSSPSRSHYAPSLPSIHQLSPQRTPVQPPPFPSPMQRLPSQEYLPHHSPTSDHQPLQSPMSYSHSNVPHSPYSTHQPSLPHPVQSPRGSFSGPTMPPPQYSPTHTPQPYYQGQYPPQSPSSGYTSLQPAFQPQPSPRDYAPPPSTLQQDNRLPPINTPTQLPPLQYTTPKPNEQGRATSPLRPRPEEISPVLTPDDGTGGVPEMDMDEKTVMKKKRVAKGKPMKVEPVDEPQEPATKTRRGSRQESVDPHDDKTPKPTRGKAAKGASKSKGTAASSRTRRGQSVSRSTAEPEDMNVDDQTTKEESEAPETIQEEPAAAQGGRRRGGQARETADTEEPDTGSKGKRGGRTTRKQAAELESHRQNRQGTSASTEPEAATTIEDNANIETPRDAATPVEPATPRPPFHLDMSVNATPTSSSATQVKKFAQRANPLLTNVAAHRYANLFMKPVDDKMAPAYSNTIYRPQDIKSIRAAIKIGAAQTAGTGTPTPTPTADGPSASFGTTPSTPTTASALSVRGAITNSAQLEKEIMRMFANAIVYNRSSSVVAEHTKEMARDIGAAIDNFRNAERIGERKAMEAAAKERERGVAAGLMGTGAKRRGSLIKSEIMGDDDSRKDDDEDEQEEEEEEEQPAKPVSKKGKGAPKPKGPAAARTRRGSKRDQEGDVEMEDKAEEENDEAVESSDADKTAEEEEEEDDDEEEEEDNEDEEGDEEEDEEEDDDDEEDEEEEEEEQEVEEKNVKPTKGKAATTAAATATRAKNSKTRAAAPTATAAKGRGTRKGSVQSAADADGEEAEKGKGGRGRGGGRTRAAKGR